jgi:hypothetical protein
MSWFDDAIVEPGRLPLFLLFVAFIVTFAVTRAITRLIRAERGPFRDNVSDSGLHIHHAVPGLLLLIAGAFLAVGAAGQTGWAELAGVLVGVGTSLVLDEFALILHLDDVYWSEEGRVSVEMVALAVACLGLALLGFRPFRFDGAAGTAAVVLSIVGIVMHVVWVVIVVAKGKYPTALFAAFIPLVGPVGGLRLAQPGSRWATKFYDEAKTARAERRAATHDARYGRVTTRVADLLGGEVGSSPD